MIWRTRSLLASVTLASFLALGVGGCSTTTDDVHRWARTSQGPRKLVAVLVHDKYTLELRTEAALTLVRMKPRSGRRVGLETLLEAMADMAPGERAKVVTKMVPALDEEIRKPPPPAQAGQPAAEDPATTAKDAAFAMLTYDDAVLIEDDGAREILKGALGAWVSTDFGRRMDDPGQLYGVEQVLRFLGVDGAKTLPRLLVPGAKKIDRLASLIAELGDKETRLAASKNLVVVAEATASEKWLQQKAPSVEAANKASKLAPTKEQFDKQLQQFQEEELLRVFASMKRIGGKPVADYLIKYASSKDHPEKRRAAALAALESRVDKNDATQVSGLLALAGADDTPDVVRGQALARFGELPRAVVIEKLYELFKKDSWKIRWVAAELAISMSDATNIGEVMSKVGQIKGMTISEPIVYGPLLAKLGKTEDHAAIADKYAGGQYSFPTRATALGYYYGVGTKTDLAKITKYEDDRTKAPNPDCGDEQAGCEWSCDIPKGKGTESKDIKTLGDFVTYCVRPAMEKRVQPPPKDKKKEKK